MDTQALRPAPDPLQEKGCSPRQWVERIAKVNFSWEEVKINFKILDLGRLRCSFSHGCQFSRVFGPSNPPVVLGFVTLDIQEVRDFCPVDLRFDTPHLCDDIQFSVLLPKRATLLVDDYTTTLILLTYLSHFCPGSRN